MDSTAPDGKSGADAAARAERILVVDDIEDNRQLLIRRLRREGFAEIATAADGAEALERIAREPFDLVLLDVMMPNLDGYQMLERLRAAGRLHELPVIVVSALNEIDSIVRCIQLGAVDYLPKPFNATLLRARARRCISSSWMCAASAITRRANSRVAAVAIASPRKPRR